MMCGRLVFTILLILSSLMGCAVSRIEEPKFELIDQSGDFEIRKYASTIVAETLVEGDFYGAPNEGFRRLAGYIFGKNTAKNKIAMTAPVGMSDSSAASSEKIAMTAPVGMKEASPEKIAMTAPVSQAQVSNGEKDKQWMITFTMPSSYSLETLPTPNDPRVKLKQVPGYRAAVLKFTGFNSDEKVKKNITRLEDFIKSRNLKAAGTPIYARYNPPWTPWFLRRHELIIPLE